MLRHTIHIDMQRPLEEFYLKASLNHAPVELFSEEDVGGLALTVCNPFVVGTSVEVKIVNVHATLQEKERGEL
jgi:hypothetical protein